MFLVIAASVFVGMMFGTCLGTLVLSLAVVSSRVSDQS